MYVPVPWLVLGIFANFATVKSSVALQLYGAFVRKNDVLERVVTMCQCPLQSLSLIHVAY